MEEAPTPNSNDIAKTTKKIIEIKCDNKKYIITLSYLTNLKICINFLEKRQIYEDEFSFDDITKINRYFLMCESIKDIYEELSSHINDETKIDFGNNSLTLKIFLPSQKNKEADFVLNLKKKSLEEEINYLNERIYEQEKIIKEQNTRIINQENDIKLLKKKIANLENKISSILTTNNENEKIFKLMQLIGRNCNLQLIYQMKKDGNSCATFHEKVDNQGPTITLFETEDGYKFGGYTSKSFQQKDVWIKDSDSFLFNFLNLKKFPIKNASYDAIFLGNNRQFGPEFYDILLIENNIKKGKIRVEHYINKAGDLKDGDINFINNDVLVYKVNFI